MSDDAVARCPGCGLQAKVPAAQAGRMLKCPRCATRFTATAAPAATVPEAAVPAATRLGSAPPAATSLEGPAPTSGETTPPAVARREWQPGEVVLDLYRVIEVLGQGGMGRVYRVHHLGWDLDLAVKAPLPEALEALGGPELFEAEAETWVNLGLHPHVVSCYYVRRVGGLPVVFAELVDGGSLHDAIRGRRLRTLEDLLDAAIQFAWGLHYAHELGLVHRDVKPANVMVTSGGVVKVTDFGLARSRPGRALPSAARGGQTLIVAGGVAGTPAYMAPEQSAGDPLTRRADLWAWALSVLEMFQGGRTWEYGVVGAQALEDYVAAGGRSVGRPAMPRGVVELLRLCLRDAPEERPRSLWDAAAVLYAAYEQASGAPYPRAEPQAGRATADSLTNRAVSLLDLGRDGEAPRLWDEALRAQPHHLEATYDQALHAWSAGRLTDAELLARVEEAAGVAPSPRALQLIGRLQLAVGDGARAIAVLEKALAGASTTTEIAADLASARTAHGAGSEGTVAVRGLAQPATALARGRHLLTLEGGAIRVRDAGSTARTLSVPELSVRCLAPLGRSVLCGGDGGPLQLVDLETGRTVRTLARHTGNVTAVAVAADGQLAVAGGSDRAVRVYELTTGRVIHALSGHAEAVSAVAVTPDGRMAASGALDGTVRLWDTATGALRHELTGGRGRVVAVHVTDAEGLVLALGEDRVLRQWDVESGRLVRALAGPTQPVHALAVSGDERFAVTGGADRAIRIWDVARGRSHAVVRLAAAVTALAFDDDGVVWAAAGHEVLQLRVPERPRLPAFAVARPVSAVEVESRDLAFQAQLAVVQETLRSGDLARALELARALRAIPGYERSEPALALWDEIGARLPKKGLQATWESAVLEGHTDPVLAVAIGADGRRVASGGLDHTVRLWDPGTRQQVTRLEGHTDTVSCVALVGDGRTAVSGAWDRTVRVWDVAGARAAHVLEGHEDHVTGVAVSPDAALVASASRDQTIRLWEIAHGTPRRTLAGHDGRVTAVAWSADGRFLASAAEDATVRAWDAATGACVSILSGHEDAVSAVAISPTCRQLASGGVDRTVRIWDLRRRAPLRTCGGHEAEVTAVAFTPDGRYVWSASRDKTLRLWDVATGKCEKVIAHTAALLALAVAPTGNEIVAGGADRTVRLWHLDWEPDPRPPASWDEAARPFLETFASIRLKPETMRTVAATGKWNDQELDQLVADLQHRGFGGVTRETVTGKLQDLARRERQGGAYWDEVQRTAVVTPPRPARAASRAPLPWTKIAAGAAIALSLVVLGVRFLWKPAPRLLPFMVERQRKAADVIPLEQHGGDCSAGGLAYWTDVALQPEVSAPSLACLASFREPATVDTFLDGAPLDDLDASVRVRRQRSAIALLVALGDVAAEPLCAHLADPRPAVRGVAHAALGILLVRERSPRAAACVSGTLRDASLEPPRRAAAGELLPALLASGLVDAPTGWKLLSQLRSDGDPGVRRAGVAALTMYDGALSESAAATLEKDPDAGVREAAAAAVKEIRAGYLYDH